MAMSHLKIITKDKDVNEKTWRTYGGNRSEVRNMYAMYRYMNFAQIQIFHKMSVEEFLTLEFRLSKLGSPEYYFSKRNIEIDYVGRRNFEQETLDIETNAIYNHYSKK